jgi:aryl-alcohol dehydrogenase-like predicted oxidoreductase
MMQKTYSRRDALRWAGAVSIATTFLPLSRHRAFAQPASGKLQTRVLGRTGREVSTFGLGGVICLMEQGDYATGLIVKTIKAGVTFLDTGNGYGGSQLNYGAAFRELNLVPGQPGYQAALRSRLFVSTKLGSRYAIIRDDTIQSAGSRGGGARALDELKRSLTQMFGDGQGYVPDGAYVDMMHVHNLNSEAAVDMVFEGLDNPGDKSLPRVGTLTLLVDYRDGTNLTGLNPDHKKWIRHIAMSCHENPTSVMYAMRKDKNNIFEGLMCTINPNDPGYFSFETNAMPVAQAKNVGVMAMKVFSDGVFWGKGEHWGGEWIKTIGQPDKVPYQDFIAYSLSAPGVHTAVIGIGEVDKNNDPKRDQFVADLAACQTARDLTRRERKDIIEQVAGLHGIRTNFYQRPGSGLQPPQNVRLNRAGDGPVEVCWDTAYAGASPLATYEVYRRHDLVARVPYAPQTSEEPFRFVDNGAKGRFPGGLWYRVRVVDAEGVAADSNTVLAPQAPRLSG